MILRLLHAEEFVTRTFSAPDSSSFSSSAEKLPSGSLPPVSESISLSANVALSLLDCAVNLLNSSSKDLETDPVVLKTLCSFGFNTSTAEPKALKVLNFS